MKFNISTIILSMFLAVITNHFWKASARPLFTSTETVNKRINDAVNKERQSWQKKISENENKIKILQSDLNKAVAESKKLSDEKVSYEQKAKDDLTKVKKEKENAINDLAKAKKEFETTKKQLDTSITSLQKEVQVKEAEKSVLSKKVSDTENARLASETNLKKTIDTTKKQYNTKIKNLNKQISQKTKQLKQKTNQLNALSSEYKTQSENVSKAETNAYYELEILKGEVKKLKTELRILVENAKAIESEREQYVENMQKKFMIERKNFVQQVKANQDLELQNLLKIEQLNNLIHQLILKNSKLDEAGKTLEAKLMAKIETLKKQQKLFAKKYELVINAYAKAEAKNLQTIDALNQELSDAKAKNLALIKVAEQMNKSKIVEDIADSRLEANTLLKVDDLTNELNNAIHKNKLLVSNIGNIKEHINKIKQSNSETEQKYQKDIKTLTKELEKAATEFKKLSEKYNNRGNWKKEKLEFSKNNISTQPQEQEARKQNTSMPEVPGFKEWKAIRDVNYDGTHKNSSYESDNFTTSSKKQEYPAPFLRNTNFEKDKQNYPKQPSNKAGYWYNSETFAPISTRRSPAPIPTSTEYENGTPYFHQQQNRTAVHTNPRFAPSQRNSLIYSATSVENNNSTPDFQWQSNGNVMPANTSLSPLEGTTVSTRRPWVMNAEGYENNTQYIHQQQNHGMIPASSGFAHSSQKNSRGYPTSMPTGISAGNGTPETTQQQDYSYPPRSGNLPYQSAISWGKNRNVKHSSENKQQNTPHNYDEVMANLNDIQIKPKTSEENLVEFAIDAILKAIQKMTHYDVDKTNAAMNLIGSGEELPQQLNAIMEVTKEKYNPAIFEKAITEIANRYTQRKNFMNESMKHLYGKNGDKLINWSDIP